MEFIPLEQFSVKNKKKKASEKQKTRNTEKFNRKEMIEKVIVKETKPKPQQRFLKKKSAKNKYEETLALKQKKKTSKKNTHRRKEEEDKEEIIVEFSKDEHEIEKKQEENEIKLEEEALKRKCKEMDEKKKNRLFVKLKNKIYSEAQIKELHPDVRQVIFPRKKNSRWCWAVFSSEEKANEAMKQLVKNKDVFISKPNPYERVHRKIKEKMKTISLKKEAKKKLQKMWM